MHEEGPIRDEGRGLLCLRQLSCGRESTLSLSTEDWGLRLPGWRRRGAVRPEGPRPGRPAGGYFAVSCLHRMKCLLHCTASGGPLLALNWHHDHGLTGDTDRTTRPLLEIRRRSSGRGVTARQSKQVQVRCDRGWAAPSLARIQCCRPAWGCPVRVARAGSAWGGPRQRQCRETSFGFPGSLGRYF